jgi:hypothetical protein
MTDSTQSTPQHWARVRPEDQHRYPAVYQGKWFRVLQRHDPDVPVLPGYIWIEVMGKEQRVWALHFEIREEGTPQ